MHSESIPLAGKSPEKGLCAKRKFVLTFFLQTGFNMKTAITFCLLLLSAAIVLGQTENRFRLSGALGFGHTTQSRWMKSVALCTLAGGKQTSPTGLTAAEEQEKY